MGFLSKNDIYPGMVEAPTPTQEASGALTDKGTAKPAMYWGALVAMLVVLRLLYERGGKG